MIINLSLFIWRYKRWLILLKTNDIISMLNFKDGGEELTKVKTNNQLLLILCVVLFSLLLCSCGNNIKNDSIIGKWRVTAYELNGEVVDKEKVGEYMGETFATIERPMLLFQESGLVRIYTESGSIDETINYTVTDNIIELYKNEEHGLYLEKDDDTIRLKTDSDNIIILYTKE